MFISLLSAALITSSPLATAGPGSCSEIQIKTGTCSLNNTGSEIVIDGSKTDPGSPDTSPVDDRDDDSSWRPDDDSDYISPEDEFARCLAAWDSYIACFEAIEQADPADPADPTPALPAVTITDLARFAPAATPLAGEPDNVGVAGLPTNFVATASAHSVDGELFGFPITVRFTPVGFDFDYGDGAATTTTGGGRSWADLDQAQFTPTATSHAYAERGEYLASVDVRYTAEIDLGIGWYPIDGELTTTGPQQQIRIYEAHTALVAHTCEQAPSSPGC